MNFKQAVKDIRFWLLIYFLIRLFGITNPPLEIAHNWRQTTGLMVARNFYETDPHILYPRVDMAGEKTGITGTEFPLFNYLIYLTALVFGWADWYGRLINLIFTTAGIYFFYRLIADFIRKDVAFYSAFILLNSLWFTYARKTMPDTFSMALLIASLWFGLKYLKQGQGWRVFAFWFLACCGALSKIPSAYLLGIFLLPFFNSGIDLIRKVLISIACLFVLIPVSIWYFYWVPYLNENFGFWHYYMGTSFSQGTQELFNHLDQAAEKFYFQALGFIGFAVFITGLIFIMVKKQKILLALFLISFLLFLVFMLKAGFAFYHHSYYIMPFVPVMALIAGYAIFKIQNPVLRTLMLTAIAAEALGNGQHDLFIPRREEYKLRLESITDRFCAKKDLVAINCGANPQQIYLCHRKGWNITSQQATDPKEIEKMKTYGLVLLIINKHEAEVQRLPYPKVMEDADFAVYRI